ncbi:MAG: PIN domain-containing protein [Planctomycetes bacterium]|nr:PIN domain-containing protein [Planctomycetota bacterium]
MNAVDTNVLVYACDKTDPHRQTQAIELLRVDGDCALLWQVACEFIAASRKLEPDGFTATEAWQHLGTLLKMMPLVLPTAAVFERAMPLHADRRCSFWDAMLYAACLEAGVSRLYSEDTPGTTIPGLEIINPFRG